MSWYVSHTTSIYLYTYINICIYIQQGSDKYQGNIGHGVEYDSLMLWSVLGHSPQVGFQDVIPIEQRHFPIWPDPDLVFSKWSEVFQGRHVETEFPSFSKLSKASPNGEELISRDGSRLSHRILSVWVGGGVSVFM